MTIALYQAVLKSLRIPI